MMGRPRVRAAVAAAASLLLAGCYGGWLFGIVQSFGLPGDAKITTVAGNGTAGFSGDGGPATAAELNQPSGVAVDSAGNLYIADTNNSVIRKVDSSGKITTMAGTPGVPGYGGNAGAATSANLNNPLGIAVGSAGNIYVADSNNNWIRVIDPGGAINLYAGSGTPISNRGYIGDGGSATSALLDFPTGVAADGAGNICIADFNNSEVRMVSSSVINTVAGSYTLGPGYLGDGHQATDAELNYPYGVAVDSVGNIYIADTTNNVVRKVEKATGIISTFAGNGTGGYSGDGGPATSASLNGPTGVAVDANGNVYIALGSVVRKVDQSGTITTVAGNWHLGNGFAGDGNVATSAMLNIIFGIAVDSAGNLYIADTHNNRIRKVTFGP